MKIEKIPTNFNEHKSTVGHKMNNGKIMLYNFGNGDGKHMSKAVKFKTDPKHKIPRIVVPYSNNVDESDKTYGIYAYINNKTGVVIYIGMDKYIKNGKRNYDHYLPSNFNDQKINMELQRNPDKYAYMALETGLSKSECVEREIELIDAFGTYENRLGFGKSYGYNMIRTAADIKHNFTYKQTIDLRTGREWKNPAWGRGNKKNTTGVKRVSIRNGVYRYQYWNVIGDKRTRMEITGKTMDELEQKVIDRGLSWDVIE